LENGLRYQLTWTNLNQIHDQLISPKYILPNFYNYTLLPFQTLPRFPFIKPQAGILPQFLRGSELPDYHSEEVTGILFGAPFFLFVLWPAAFLVRKFATGRKKTDVENLAKFPGLHDWMVLSLLGSSIISFSTLLSYFYITMRFMADFSFTLAPLAAMGFWHGCSLLSNSRIKRRIYFIGGVTLSSISILVSVLLTLSDTEKLQKMILHVFGHIIGVLR
jgi:hypothetical protein